MYELWMFYSKVIKIIFDLVVVVSICLRKEYQTVSHCYFSCKAMNQTMHILLTID